MAIPVKQSTLVTVPVMCFGTDGITAITSAYTSAQISVLKPGETAAIAALGGQSTIHAGGGCHLVPLATGDVSALGMGGKVFLAAGSTTQAPAWADIEIIPAITYDTLYGSETTRLSALTTRGTAALTSTDVVALSTAQVVTLSTAQVVALATTQLGGLPSTRLDALDSASLMTVRRTSGLIRGTTSLQADTVTASYSVGFSGSKLAVVVDNIDFATDEPYSIVIGDISLGGWNNQASTAVVDGGTLTFIVESAALPAGTLTFGYTDAMSVAHSDTYTFPALPEGAEVCFGNDGVIRYTAGGVLANVKADVGFWLGSAASPALTATSVPAITAAQMTTTQLGGQTTQFVSALTTADVSTLTSSQVSALLTSQITTLATGQIVALPTSQIVSLPSSYLGAQGTQYVSSLTTADVSALTTADIDTTITANTYIGEIRANTFTSVAEEEFARKFQKYTANVLTAGGLDGSLANDATVNRVLLATESITLSGESINPSTSTADLGVITSDGVTNTWTPDAGWSGALSTDLYLTVGSSSVETDATVTLAAKRLTSGAVPEDISYEILVKPGGVFQTWGIEGVARGLYNCTTESAAPTDGTGLITWTTTVDDGSDPIDGCTVWCTTDAGGTNIVASGTTDAFGVVTFYLDAGTYYLWAQKSGFNFTNPKTQVVA